LISAALVPDLFGLISWGGRPSLNFTQRSPEVLWLMVFAHFVCAGPGAAPANP